MFFHSLISDAIVAETEPDNCRTSRHLSLALRQNFNMAVAAWPSDDSDGLATTVRGRVVSEQGTLFQYKRS